MVLTDERDPAQRALGGVVVERDPGVVEEDAEFVPLAERVADGGAPPENSPPAGGREGPGVGGNNSHAARRIILVTLHLQPISIPAAAPAATLPAPASPITPLPRISQIPLTPIPPLLHARPRRHPHSR